MKPAKAASRPGSKPRRTPLTGPRGGGKTQGRRRFGGDAPCDIRGDQTVLDEKLDAPPLVEYRTGTLEFAMRMWTGQGAFQWEHSRQWALNNASEFCRGDGALVLPGGFGSLSIFFRRHSQSGGTFELRLWTAPIFFKLLDDLIDASNAAAQLYPLTLTPSTGLTMVQGGAEVFGAKLDTNQPMGTLLFWQVINTAAEAGTIVGDIFVVPNYTGTMATPQLSRTVDGSDMQMSAIRGYPKDR